MEKLRAFFAAHRWAVCCSAAGLVLALLLITIGFWRTLLLAAIVGCALWIGCTLDRSGKEGLQTAVNKLMKKDNNA